MRGAGIAFTEPYVLIEGSYLVRQDSPLRANEEVDRAGLRVAVGKGSAYDLYLTRELKAAESCARRPRPPWSTPSWNKAGRGRRRAPAARGRRGPPCRAAPAAGPLHGDPPGHGCPKGYPAEAQRHLADFVERMKAGGFVADALARHGIQGASVAPAAVRSESAGA